MTSSSVFSSSVVTLIFSWLLTSVYSTNSTHHHGNRTTNQVEGIQEELQLIKGTVQTLVTLVNVVNNKVDTNTNNIQTLTNKCTTAFSKVESNSKKVDAAIKKIDSVSRLALSISKKVESTAKKLDSTTPKVDSNTRNAHSNSRIIAELTEEISPLRDQCGSLPSNICGTCKCRDDKRLPKKYYCDCTRFPAKRDCKQFLQEGFTVDGLYKIHQNKIRVIQIFCDQTSEGGGWSVFQRRLDGSVNFYRDWVTYKAGFGEPQYEFWLGNTNLYTLNLQGMYPSGNELLVELTDWNGVKKIAKYRSFEISNESRKFQLNIDGYSGTAGDSMVIHNGLKFATFDQDPNGCAVAYFGGWWYGNCHWANLNGKYYNFRHWEKALGVCWYTYHGHDYSLKHVEMKMRRNA